MVQTQKVYGNGFPFSDPLPKNIDLWTERVQKRKKASLIIIDGGVGEGKTTLAVHTAMYINKGSLDYSKQLAMGGEDFVTKLDICAREKLPVIIYDEAGDFNRRRGMTKANDLLNRVFDTYRAFKIVVIIVLPCVKMLDKPLFDKGIVRCLLHCFGRTQTRGDFKAYSLYRLFYLKDKLDKYKAPILAYSHVFPNFFGHFKDLDEKNNKILDEISTASKKEILSEITTKLEGLSSVYDISEKLDMSLSWVRKQIVRNKFKPVKVHKNKKYYSEDCFNKLSDVKKVNACELENKQGEK